MGIRSSFRGPCAPTAEVSKYINTSYDIVKYVADNMVSVTDVYNILVQLPIEDLQTILDNIDSILIVRENVVDVNTVATNIVALVELSTQVAEILAARDIALDAAASASADAEAAGLSQVAAAESEAASANTLQVLQELLGDTVIDFGLINSIVGDNYDYGGL